MRKDTILSLLEETYDTNMRYLYDKKYTPFWDFLDMCIDEGARYPLFVTNDEIFSVAKEFCEHMHIAEEDIPSLYKYIFATEGFLQKAKVPYYISTEWLERFPTEVRIQPCETMSESLPDILVHFKRFLEAAVKVHHDDAHAGLQYEMTRTYFNNVFT